MASLKENLQRAAPGLVLGAAFVAALIWLPAGWAMVVGALFALVGVVRLRRPMLRNGALALASLLLAMAAVELAFWMLAPNAPNVGASKQETPPDWYPQDPDLGFKPRPNTTIAATASYDGKPLYNVTYHIDDKGGRVVPGSVDQGPTWLFVGDSYMFSEGVEDRDTLPSMFARRLDPPAHVVNTGVPGYGSTNIVRAFELGTYDKQVIGKVAAVIAWATPPLLIRVTGDASWMNTSPRYDFGSDGKLHWSGSFGTYRWTHPWAGASYYARSNVGWIRRATEEYMEREQTKLYIALMARLAELARERYDAPLILLSNGPEKEPADQPDLQYLPAFDGLRALGIPIVSVRKKLGPVRDWQQYFIPHDGHPTPKMNALVTDALIETLTTLKDKKAQ
ncbi:MAG: hypothetical protein JSR24_03925 [Proteobacteria bacterium]|nr:hypothetical protein [Pseudomonadota bacterium]